MIFDDYFIVIPVYRLSEEKYFSDMNNDFELKISSSWDRQFREENADLERTWKKHHRRIYGGDWEFNEIVGHIKLYFMGTQVRGEYWSTEPSRKIKTRRKQFVFKTHKLFVESTIWDKTNDGILSAIEDYLSGCKKELKRRHIDLREFDTLKKHIDWMSIYKSKNKFA